MLFILALLLASSTGRAAELLVHNAVVYSGVPGSQPLSAILSRDGRIAATGPAAVEQASKTAQRIDAGGRTIVPGFIDSHGHMSGLGEMVENLDLRGVAEVAKIAAMVRERAARTPRGQWIQGRAWDQTNWGGTFPTQQALNDASPEHPVLLRRVDGHAAWVNRKALELAGITRETADPPGGRIVHDSSGEPTGILIDRAQELVGRKLPAPTPQQVRDRLARAAEECARLGLTGVHDAGVGETELAAYRDLIRAGRMPVRVYAMIGGAGPLWRKYLEQGPEIGERLTVRSVKLYADGAMGSRGAAFWQPYSDDPGNTGLLLATKEQIESVARDAVRRGFQVNTHAIGDRANRTALDAYAAALGGQTDRRFRIEHAQVVSLPDFASFAKLGVIASIQATHATSDMRWAEARLGPDRMAGAWAWQRFLKAGARIANGSDFPVESANPLWGFYASVTRQDHQGNPPGGFQPDQRLTREQALRSWTLDGAYAAFEERDKGTLEPGKVADFVMLSHDIMRVPDRELLQAHVLMTILGGEVVYRAQE